jgi:sulfoxide reductase catalytic subunit YedY
MVINLSKQNPSNIQPSDITTKQVYQNRRHFLKMAMRAGVIAGSGRLLTTPNIAFAKPNANHSRQKINGVTHTDYGADLTPTQYKHITTYNNYYEFGSDKADPANNAKSFQTRPWTISIEGEVKQAKTISIEDLMQLAPLEERIYRMRCVEAWSMVIPWVGLPLSSLINWAQPTGNAKFIEFVSANDPASMPGVKFPTLDWPYTEGLRMDEAMHPLTLLALGVYGEVLPNQNGAPVRLVVPWKYGFKGAKAIVKIRFVEEMPQTTWSKAALQQYGFYANVNPEIAHPRWGQATEKPIGQGLFTRRVKTRKFNGYESEVAHLYQNMDLKSNF